jgi:FixJ family two-component response regulator
MPHVTPVIHIVDADDASRRSVARLLQSAGFQSAAHDSVAPLMTIEPDACACVLLDLDAPATDGLAVQRELREHGLEWPLIFVTARGDFDACVRAVKGGADDYLVKPLRRARLVDAVQSALCREAARAEQRAREHALRQRFASLTGAERAIFVKVVAGMLNKQIASEFGRSERTIKGHRSRMMSKMRAASVADLVRMGQCLGIGADAFQSLPS